MRTLSGWALLCATAVAGPVEDAADAVLAGTDLPKLAARDKPDPWLVADELCSRGERAAAVAFARAAPRPDTEALPAHVTAHVARPQHRAALAEASHAFREGRHADALRAADSVPVAADTVIGLRVLHVRASALLRLRRWREAAEAYRSAGAAARRLGWLSRAATLFLRAGIVHYDRSDFRGALQAWTSRLEVERARGNRRGIAAGLGKLGICHDCLGDYASAVSYGRQSLAMARELGDLRLQANALGNLGVVHRIKGEFEEALECQTRALELERRQNSRSGVAETLANLGNIHQDLGRYTEALGVLREALELSDEKRDLATIARLHSAIGNIHLRRAECAKARFHKRKMLEGARAIGDRQLEANAIGDLGVAHMMLAEYATALSLQEQALRLKERLGGNPMHLATTVAALGVIHLRLGEAERGRTYLSRSLAIQEKIGDRQGAAVTLANIGATYAKEKRWDLARQFMHRSLKLRQQMGDRLLTAAALANLGAVEAGVGNYEAAFAYDEKALRLMEEAGDQAGAAQVLDSIGLMHARQGRLDQAIAFRTRALALAREIGAVDTEMKVLSGLGGIHLLAGRPKRALAFADEALGRLPLVVGRLSDAAGAAAREEWTDLLEVGVKAGVRLDDPAAVSRFLESGRAGSLLESLGGSGALREAVVPEVLLTAESDARSAVVAATRALDRGRRAGDVKRVREARARLAVAQQELVDAVATIQRESKLAADVAYPNALPLAEIQAGLGDTTLVSYALLAEEAVALVVRADRARIVPLGRTIDAERALDALAPGKIEPDAVRHARALFLESLRLPADTRRLLVSPHGALAYLPFALLAPELEVTCVPSGTTLALLRAAAPDRGKAVLALGDPDYGTAHARPGVHATLRGGGLAPLPATRAEAKAVGDVVLLGAAATEGGLAGALAQRTRWRAVHLACHGLVDPGRPLLSSLALTSGGGEDGFLTTVEVLRMKIPADLVVLSACETAKGKVYRAEGVVGFTRAFMLAGAPRVIVSLWKVDDAATRELMVKFYELWKPGTMSTAGALRAAQDHVRKQEKWRDPRYWAAWQLWGLPD